ncbi:MAG: redoxin domain-containing protein [Ktedonobacterales bacterium]|nr:redoxin domain-containing protein [Ktedonobacterales bacterium]
MSAPQSLAETQTLKVGDTAPDFTLPDANGSDPAAKITLSDYRGKQNVVLAFFPYAFSGTCSAQMPSYEAELERFNTFDTQVIGISMDGKPALVAWAKQLKLSFPLLADFYPQGKVVDLYGVRHVAGMPERALFVIDKQGVVQWVHVHRPTGETPDNEELFEVLRKLQ